MRIFIADTYFQSFLNQFYLNNDVGKFSYPGVKQRLFSSLFGLSNYYSLNLRALGHQAEEFITNDSVSQNKWAKEHGMRSAKQLLSLVPLIRSRYLPEWVEEIIEAQIADYRPDILYCQNLSFPGSELILKIRKKVKSIKFVIGQTAYPIPFEKRYLSGYDLVLTSFPHYVRRLRKMGVKSEYFRIGFEHTILSRLKGSKSQYGVVFVGGFSRYHLKSNFLSTFEYLASKTRVDFWGYGAKYIPQESPVWRTYHSAKFGIDMYQVLFNSKISLNRHINVAEEYANNMRLYESTGVGTMLITDDKKNIGELFVPGKEIETYKNKDELVDKVTYYLSHKKEREKIAKAGQARTLKDHTYYQRMRELDRIIKKHI